MPQQHWPPRPKQIYIPVPIRIQQVRTLSTRHKRRIPTHCAKRAHRRIHTTRKKLFRTLL
jgi:hypothetical protein